MVRPVVFRSRVRDGPGGPRPTGRSSAARSPFGRSRRESTPLTSCSSCPRWRSWRAFSSTRSSTALVLSVHETKGFDLTAFVGLDHYAHALFGDAVFHQALLHTVLFTGAAVLLQTGLGLLLAVLVADVGRGRTFWQFAFFAPFVLASVAVGAVWKFMYAPYFGIVPTVGSAIGVNTLTVAPLADAHWALWAIMAAFLWRFTGFSMVVYLAAIQALPREYYEQAVLEGAGTAPAAPADHLALALAADVRAGPAHHDRDPADLRHGLADDRRRTRRARQRPPRRIST